LVLKSQKLQIELWSPTLSPGKTCPRVRYRCGAEEVSEYDMTRDRGPFDRGPE
jgi:hypothetical protein